MYFTLAVGNRIVVLGSIRVSVVTVVKEPVAGALIVAAVGVQGTNTEIMGVLKGRARCRHLSSDLKIDKGLKMDKSLEVDKSLKVVRESVNGWVE
jgi:hypothetical protein